MEDSRQGITSALAEACYIDTSEVLDGSSTPVWQSKAYEHLLRALLSGGFPGFEFLGCPSFGN